MSRTIRASLQLDVVALGDGVTESSTVVCLSSNQALTDPVELELLVKRRLFDSESGEELLADQDFSSADPVTVSVRRLVSGGSEVLAVDMFQQDLSLSLEVRAGYFQDEQPCQARFMVTTSSPHAGSSAPTDSTVDVQLKVVTSVSPPEGSEPYPTLLLSEEDL